MRRRCLRSRGASWSPLFKFYLLEIFLTTEVYEEVDRGADDEADMVEAGDAQDAGMVDASSSPARQRCWDGGCIILSSKAKMNSFNRLLVAFAIYDSLLIIFMLMDHSFIRGNIIA